MNTPYGNSITTAEHAIAMMFALARQIPAADRSTQAGKWEKYRFMGVELIGKTLGLIGCGNIGSIVADRAQGLKMRVVAYDPFLSPERALELGVEKVELDELLARADFITLHTPLTERPATSSRRGNLAKTKPGVRIINCARGGLVDEAALHDADRGRPRRRRRARRVRDRAGDAESRCSRSTRSSARRISAPPPARRRRTSRCRSPSRWATSC